MAGTWRLRVKVARFATSADDGQITIWDCSTNRIHARFEGHWKPVNALAFSPDSKCLASASGDGTSRMWETLTGCELKRKDSWFNIPNALLFSRNGKTLFAGMSDGTVRCLSVLSAETAKEEGKKRLSDRQAEKLWQDLTRIKGPRVCQVVSSLSADPQAAIRLFRKRLRPIPHDIPERIQQLIGMLDSDSFRAREYASGELAKFGILSDQLLKEAFRKSDSAEVRSRAQVLIKRNERGIIADAQMLRTMRTIWILELIGTTAAQDILKDLAQGLPSACSTREAKDALDRLMTANAPTNAR